MAEAVLLDTCACLWLAYGDPMSEQSRQAITEAQVDGSGIYVSPITAWEIATLVSKGRYRLMVSAKIWFARLLALRGMRLAALTPDILIDSAFLPGEPPNDPADRILAATSRHLGHAIVTRDRRLLAYGANGHLGVIPC